VAKKHGEGGSLQALLCSGDVTHMEPAQFDLRKIFDAFHQLIADQRANTASKVSAAIPPCRCRYWQGIHGRLSLFQPLITGGHRYGCICQWPPSATISLDEVEPPPLSALRFWMDDLANNPNSLNHTPHTPPHTSPTPTPAPAPLPPHGANHWYPLRTGGKGKLATGDGSPRNNVAIGISAVAGGLAPGGRVGGAEPWKSIAGGI